MSIYHRKVEVEGDENNFANIEILTFIAVNGRGEVFFSVFLISFGLKADDVSFFLYVLRSEHPYRVNKKLLTLFVRPPKLLFPVTPKEVKKLTKKTANNSQHLKLQLKCNFTCYFTLFLHCRMRSHLDVYFFLFFAEKQKETFGSYRIQMPNDTGLIFKKFILTEKRQPKKKAAKKKRKKDL